ncbi:MAG: hypothetical protein ACKPE2_33480, partial [Dolichospermum sp.]
MSSSTKTVVFIDPSVQDYQNQVKPGTLLFLLNGNQNGIQQITQNPSGLTKTEWSLTLGSYPSLSSEVSTVPASPKSQVVFPTSLSIDSSGYLTSPAPRPSPASVPTAAAVTTSPASDPASVPTAEGGNSRVNQDNLNQKTGENQQANSPMPVVDRGDFYWADGQQVKL